MKHARPMTALVIAGLLAGTSVAADAATKHHKVVKHTRTIVLSYTGGCGIDATKVMGNAECGVGSKSVRPEYTVNANPGEKFMTMTVADASGQPVHGEMWTSAGVGNATDVPFCGKYTDQPIPQQSFQVDVDGLAADPSCPGFATSGTITITFSNLP
jgi:hypothetical protein